jgi:hypothetical protein
MSLLRTDVLTCAPEDLASELAPQLEASDYGYAIVLAGRTVLGRVTRSRLREAPPAARAEELMDAGPSTVRPHIALAELARRLERAGARTAIVTTPVGELLGVVRREDLAGRE